MAENKDYARITRAAAALLRTVGRTQEYLWVTEYGRRLERWCPGMRCCPIGAVLVAAGYRDILDLDHVRFELEPIWDAIIRAGDLENFPGGSDVGWIHARIASWNDRSCTTDIEVFAVLERAANLLEKL